MGVVHINDTRPNGTKHKNQVWSHFLGPKRKITSCNTLLSIMLFNINNAMTRFLQLIFNLFFSKIKFQSSMKKFGCKFL